jgi:hypothetical protein
MWTSPGSKYGACIQMGSPGTREGLLSPFRKPAEDQVYRFKRDRAFLSLY